MEPSTKRGVFELGEKDSLGGDYKDGRFLTLDNSKITEYAVKEGTIVICTDAFSFKKKLTRIILPASIQAIGKGAFQSCKNLEFINIPEGIETIRTITFWGNKSLKYIELPESLVEIEKDAFWGAGIETVYIKSPNAIIHRKAFNDCNSLKTIVIPNDRFDFYSEQIAECNLKEVEIVEQKHCEGKTISVTNELTTVAVSGINKEEDTVPALMSEVVEVETINQAEKITTFKDSPAFNQRVGSPSIFDMLLSEENSSRNVIRALRYLRGDGIPQSNERAFNLFKRALDENTNDLEAAYYMGVCYETGVGVASKDNSKAMEYYQIAVNGQHEPSKIRLAMMAMHSSKDKELARQLFNEALKANDIVGAYGLGLLAEFEGDYDEAFEYYSEAAEMGYAPAQNALGCLYGEGKGTNVDEQMAMQWFQMASDSGIAEALSNLGIRLFFQYHQNEEIGMKGEEMLKQAAEKGNNIAQKFLNEIERQRKVAQAEYEAAEAKRIKRERTKQGILSFIQFAAPIVMNALTDNGGNNGRSLEEEHYFLCPNCGIDILTSHPDPICPNCSSQMVDTGSKSFLENLGK